MKEKVMEAFKELGFKLDCTGAAYAFTYESLNFLWVYNDDDDEFLTISVPGIYDQVGDNMLELSALQERINSSMKYIKAYIIGESVWLFYEREIIGEEDFVTLLPRMIMRLEAAFAFSRKALKEIEDEVSKDDNGVDDFADETDFTECDIMEEDEK